MKRTHDESEAHVEGENVVALPTQVKSALSSSISSGMGADTRTLMGFYYGRFFPYKEMQKWLSYGDEESFTRREFSFTISGDIYLRYKSFRNAEEFEQQVRELCPDKIDIGAVFNILPRNHATVPTGKFLPMWKEFVVDIDVSDYSDVWSLGRGAPEQNGGGALVPSEWPFMVAAIKSLQYLLTECFGFEHIMWVYSGRRGIHGWVCDSQCRDMGNDGRSAVADFMQVYKGNERSSQKVKLGPNNRVHPAMREVYKILLPIFMEIADDQEWLIRPAGQQYVLDMCQIPELKEAISAEWETKMAKERMESSGMFAVLDQTCTNLSKKDKIPPWKASAILNFPYEVVFAFIYPRLDINVSKGLNHLLKSPFSVHPKTGRICVPIPLDQVDTFDPTAVPRLANLVDELNTVGSAERSSLAPSVKVLASFVESMESQRQKEHRDEMKVKREAAEANEWLSM